MTLKEAILYAIYILFIPCTHIYVTRPMHGLTHHTHTHTHTRARARERERERMLTIHSNLY